MDIFKKNNLKTHNKFYILCIAIILVIYLFFFSSKYIIFNSSSLKYTPLNTTFELSSGQNVQVVSMNYSSSQQLIQAEIEISYTAVEQDNNFNFFAVEKNRMGITQHYLETEVILNKNNLKVVNIKNVNNRFSQIALIIVPSNVKLNEETNTSIQSIQYTNYKKINKVSKIENLNYDGYLIRQAQRNISSKEKEIKKQEKEIEKTNAELKTINSHIEELNIELEISVGEQAETIKNDITNYQAQSDIYEDYIKECKQNISSLKNEIYDLNEKIKELQE